ncbi:NfeD family protein [Marinomonas mediterranea]|uniref:NfeD family protein n=1 Tax=Marinomonas mediterranea TaxID=119864 RepID=UPI002349CDDB|nr:NfeD family protein [Marinomonas mediterranea]WCN09818.1 NfeD family protein [Marinomonas mediterranea]WCN13902.1 NfeD family protein [Marinomonas mediterranea]
MDLLNEYLVQSLAIMGIALLVIEILVLGFSTFVLFFVGVAMIITSLLVYVDIVPETWTASVLTIAILSVILSAALWRPFKKMQGKVDHTPVKSDFVGHVFILEADIGPTSPGSYQYSGITWKIVSESELSAGTKVEVTEAQVGVMYVMAASQ